MVARFHNQAAADEAAEGFTSRFRDHLVPEEIPEFVISTEHSGMEIGYVLKQGGLVSSTSEAIRMIKQGAVRMDSEVVSNEKLTILVGSFHVYQIGRRRFKIKLITLKNELSIEAKPSTNDFASIKISISFCRISPRLKHKAEINRMSP